MALMVLNSERGMAMSEYELLAFVEQRGVFVMLVPTNGMDAPT